MTRRLVAVAMAGISLVLVGCGGDNSSPVVAATTTTTTTAAICAARDSLTASIADLRNVDIVKNGVSSLQTALSAVTDDLKGVASAASKELQPEVEALQDAIGQLGTAIKDVGAGGISAVTQAAQAVVSAASTLTKDLGNLSC